MAEMNPIQNKIGSCVMTPKCEGDPEKVEPVKISDDGNSILHRCSKCHKDHWVLGRRH
jgi:hypothetical protein